MHRAATREGDAGHIVCRSAGSAYQLSADRDEVNLPGSTYEAQGFQVDEPRGSPICCPSRIEDGYICFVPHTGLR